MSLRRHRRGGNAIEVALTMPVFLAAIFGLMDYAWYFYNEAMAVEAVRQGCRVGSVVPASNTPNPADTAFNFIDAELQRLSVTKTTLSKGTGLFSTAGGETINVHIDATNMLECDAYFQFNPLVGFVPTPDYVLSSATFELEQP